ncbi:paired small multidrug resistance pump [Cohnella sp. SGD-V74]|jgi:Membrane transporters of cations and cationic drugs|nr:paired small multidrug resistance pump [Cohnella sp. SGD-V74]
MTTRDASLARDGPAMLRAFLSFGKELGRRRGTLHSEVHGIMNRSWLLLLAAGVCEVGWVAGLKHASNAGEWALTAFGIVLSFAGLLRATRDLPVGTAYAVFTGLGAAGTVLAESLFFGAEWNAVKLLLVAVLIVGIGGLKMTTDVKPKEASA